MRTRGKREAPPKDGGLVPLRWGLHFVLSLALGFALGAAVEWVAGTDLPAWAGKYTGPFLLTGLLYGGVVAFAGALFGHLWAAWALTGAAALLLALVDYFKMTINGAPLMLADFGLATQLGQVAGVAGGLRPPAAFWWSLGGVGAAAAALFFARRFLGLRGRARLAQAAVGTAAVLVLFSGLFAVPLGNLFRVDVVTRLDPVSSRGTYGLTISLWRDLLGQKKKPPEGYSRETMEAALARLDGLFAGAAEAAEPPNIIVVLSESFFDPTRLAGVTFDRDPVPNFHALRAESISGPFFSHYLGYGTGYIEIAMQTGITGPDLGAGTNLCFLDPETYERFDALPEQFTRSGDYEAVMLHGYNSSLYNRTVTYPLLGYSRSLYEEDIFALGLERPGGAYGGYYMNDGYFFQAVLNQMEEINRGGKRAFLYAITMENHQPFEADKFHGVKSVEVEAPGLSAAETDILQVGVEGLFRADRALGELTEALRDGPPTIVAFFGDHRPTLPMPDGETVYTHLGLTPGSDLSDWTEEQIADVYSSDYLIWANEAALLRGLGGTERPSGVTAFGADLLALTGRQVSRWWALEEKAAGVELVSTELYFVSAEGTVSRSRESAALSAEEEELLRLRDLAVYDAVYGRQYITAALNAPPGG